MSLCNICNTNLAQLKCTDCSDVFCQECAPLGLDLFFFSQEREI